MPRRIAPQVGQSVSRMLMGGYLKSPPISYQAFLAYPPTSLPSRAPTTRPADDLHNSKDKAWYQRSNQSISQVENHDAANIHPLHLRDRTNSRKRAKSLLPRLSPRPIVYMADKVRERFYNDHPWEAFRPRTLVEGDTIQEPREVSKAVTDLSAWGRNPQPEDVVECTVHLHKVHGLSLSQAYHHTISSYHALRAEHEHAARSAVREAQAYGGVFTTSSDGTPSSASEIERGFRKEGIELSKGALWLASSASGSRDNMLPMQIHSGPQSSKYTKNIWSPFSRGQKYLQAALEARDRVGTEIELADAAESTDSLLDQFESKKGKKGIAIHSGDHGATSTTTNDFHASNAGILHQTVTSDSS